ncbi:hypothetical protein [Rhodospirillum sp. A1_3_36]|uniref:hypothetical protein n=1 Tax=Rhodospirillum sp. A1_3_36 TaxID=3391666 RepID=UPI0039A4BB9C
MSLANYAHACRTLAQELVESLSSEQVEDLRASLEGVTHKEWTEWMRKYAPQISAFVAATPSQRQRKKAWKDPVLRAQLSLAGYHHLLQGQHILDAVDRHGLYPGGSYRMMGSLAGDAYWDILGAGDVPFWPLPGKNPLTPEG